MSRNSPSHVVRTFKSLNLHLIDESDCVSGVWPILEPSYSVPTGLTTFLPSKAHEHASDFVHFYIEDYRFERLWREPERYVSVLSKYAGMIMPDYSTYRNMPIPMQLWNMYRARALAAFYQKCGLDVIPNLIYADERTYGPAFSGLPIGGTYATCATGIVKDKEARDYFYKGLLTAMKTLTPTTLLVYGGKLDVDLPCEVVYYENDNAARVRANVPYISASKRKALSESSERIGQEESAPDEGGTFTMSPVDYSISLTNER